MKSKLGVGCKNGGKKGQCNHSSEEEVERYSSRKPSISFHLYIDFFMLYSELCALSKHVEYYHRGIVHSLNPANT